MVVILFLFFGILVFVYRMSEHGEFRHFSSRTKCPSGKSRKSLIQGYLRMKTPHLLVELVSAFFCIQ
jgi:hypothetical protein